MKDALQARLRRIQPGVHKMQRGARDAGRRALRYAQDLWFRGKRDPRRLGLAGGALALTVLTAYGVSASMANRSLCPPGINGKAPKFLVLMDSIPQVAAGSKLDIQYEVCGLASGTPYRGKVRLVQQQKTVARKKSAAAKPLVVSFKDRSGGLATRGEQQVSLGSTKPGKYTLELVVADNKGRERKRVQKIVVR
ncbi:MAG TPA: hypothetical protein VFH26_08045 [Gemmatimonadales bacterium]|nr:hypothetical protein [Gemmatimonadales bacterium]